MELHIVVDELPTGGTGDTVPVVLPTIEVGMVPTGVNDIAAVDGVIVVGPIGAEEANGIGSVVPPNAGMDVTGTAEVPGVICPVGVEQVTTVPGVAGSDASGTGASVVSGAPGWVVAENGLGPLSGEVTIAAGAEGRPMAVVPIVETCARQALAPSSSVAIVNSKRCIAIAAPSSSAPCYAPRPCCLPPS